FLRRARFLRRTEGALRDCCEPSANRSSQDAQSCGHLGRVAARRANVVYIVGGGETDDRDLPLSGTPTNAGVRGRTTDGAPGRGPAALVDDLRFEDSNLDAGDGFHARIWSTGGRPE